MMNLKTTHHFAVLFVLLIGVGCKNNRNTTKDKEASLEENRPNIIFIMDDQHRWDGLGMVNPTVITPTLDALAKQGVFYKQAVCQAPMCVPSRNSLMFGMYPNQTGVFRNGEGIPDDQLPGKTMAQYFKDAGYETAGFGKTHWGKYKTNTRGFETRYSAELPEIGGKTMAELNPEDKAKYDEEIHSMGAGEENNIGYLGFTSKLPESVHRDGWITNQAINYIKNRKDTRPLFFYLSYMKPHAGHNVPKGYEDMYDLDAIAYEQQPPWKQDDSPHAEGVNRRDMYETFWKKATVEQWRLMTMRYYANITWIDRMMGKTLKALEKKGILDNAIIVYTSDHGEMLGGRYYRFNKYNLYEGSVRVPFILAGSALPNHINKGVISDRPVENTDVLPTLLAAAKIKPINALAGESLFSKPKRAATFAILKEREGEYAFMWRTKDYKLILVCKRKKEFSTYTLSDVITGEFYDLKSDVKEWNNLYNHASVKEIQQKYTKELLNHLLNI